MASKQPNIVSPDREHSNVTRVVNWKECFICQKGNVDLKPHEWTGKKHDILYHNFLRQLTMFFI